MPAVLAEYRLVKEDTEWQSPWRDLNRPIVAVNNNPRYVNFWRMVCGDGMNFISLVETGGKRFSSPWARLGFKGLLKAVIVSSAEPAAEEGDMEFLEMQAALEDYVSYHGLFE
jgi:hypothetical protein